MITDRAGVAASAIAAIYLARSGLAIECVSDAIRESILGIGQTFYQNGVVIEAALDWTSYIIPHVPLYSRTLQEKIQITDEMVRKECQAVCGVVPVMTRRLKTKPDQQSLGWLIHFKQKPLRNEFRLFDKSCPAMPFTRQRPIEQCQRRCGFHQTCIYTKAQRC